MQWHVGMSVESNFVSQRKHKQIVKLSPITVSVWVWRVWGRGVVVAQSLDPSLL